MLKFSALTYWKIMKKATESCILYKCLIVRIKIYCNFNPDKIVEGKRNVTLILIFSRGYHSSLFTFLPSNIYFVIRRRTVA